MAPDSDSLDVLVLGGTSWVGGEIARQAAGRGHRVTCLARGESGEPPEGVTWIRADRTDPTAYHEVAGRTWDAVFDVSWQPDQVRSALRSLAERTTHWVYVSSASVYAEEETPDTDEAAPLHDPHSGEGPVDIEVYGPAKVVCEQACRDAMGEAHVLAARAGLIAGYGDRSDRFGYWPGRVARAADGEPVITPPRDNPFQIIDVVDLAAWLVDCAEARTSGAYNAIGGVSTVGAVLDACAETTGRTPRFVNATHEWLAEHGVEPWSGPGSLPLWLPQPEYAGFMTRRNTAARAVGLTSRALRETVSDALRWEEQVGLDRERRAGLTPAREAELLSLLID
jgi:2'-hydroxyisoflavone reductase